jgi:hypothetical protein
LRFSERSLKHRVFIIECRGIPQFLQRSAWLIPQLHKGHFQEYKTFQPPPLPPVVSYRRQCDALCSRRGERLGGVSSVWPLAPLQLHRQIESAPVVSGHHHPPRGAFGPTRMQAAGGYIHNCVMRFFVSCGPRQLLLRGPSVHVTGTEKKSTPFKHCATSRKIVGSVPDKVTGFFN